MFAESHDRAHARCAVHSRSALQYFAAVQIVDVCLPTTDGRELLPTRHTPWETELKLLLERLHLELPTQSPPNSSAVQAAFATPV